MSTYSIKRYMNPKFIIWVAIGMLLLFLSHPGQIEAHSSLIKSSPAAGSRLNEAPRTVTLTFNEPLEPKLYSMKLLDSSGQSIAGKDAAMSPNHTELILNLPELEDGVYTVSYKAISADGHPIGSSYVFAVGTAGLTSPSFESPSAGSGSGLSLDMTFAETAAFLARILYYICLLGVTGWTFWGLLQKKRASEAVTLIHQRWSLYLQGAFMLSFLLMAALQLQSLLDQWNMSSLGALLFGTTIGYSWVATLILFFTGLYLLGKWNWFDAVWGLLLLAADSFNGHAFAFQPKADLVILDWVHLCAAAIWAGGLMYTTLLWRKHREHTMSFLPRFSGWALSSLSLLVVTGALLALAFLPRLSYIIYTQWGLLLLGKIVLVLGVVLIGALLRFRLKKQGAKLGALLKSDFVMMILITSIVGLFTYLNPVPPNEPLYWHEYTSKAHVTVEISPNAPGDNEFYVEVGTPENMPGPKQVLLRLTPKDDDDTPPIDVPLTLSAEQQQEAFAGFRSYAYEASGPYLPFPGKWDVEVRVMDANDDESVFNHQMRIY